MDAELDECAVVDEEIEPLAGGELFPGVLCLDLLQTPAEPDLLPPGVEILDERAKQTGWQGVGGHC